METVLKAISDWIKSLLTAAIMSNLSGLFDDVNTQVGGIAQQVGTKPSSFEPRVFAMIEALSRNVVLPIAGVILTFIACWYNVIDETKTVSSKTVIWLCRFPKHSNIEVRTGAESGKTACLVSIQELLTA